MWVNVFVVRMDYKLLLHQHFQIKAGVENNNWESEDFQPEAPAMICPQTNTSSFCSRLVAG